MLKFNGFGSVIFAFIAIIAMAWPQNGKAQDYSRDPDVRFVEKLVEFAENPPQDKAELMSQISSEFQAGSVESLRALTLGTPNAVVGALVKTLGEANAPEDIERLLSELEKNQATYLKFLNQAYEEMQKDPQRMERMLGAVQQVRGHLLANRVGAPPFGDRTIQATLISASMIQWIYSIFSPAYSLAPIQDLAIQGLPYALVAYVGLGVFQDFRAFKYGWRAYFAKVRERRHTRQNLKAIEQMLNALKKSAEVRAAAETFGYFASRDAERAGPDAFARLTKDFIAEVERLNLEPEAWAQMEAFSRSRDYFTLVADLNKNLSEHEKEILNQSMEKYDLPMPFEVQAKVMNYETQVISAFKRWMDERGIKASHGERLRDLLAERSAKRDRRMANLTPLMGYNYFTLLLGANLAVTGLQATVAADPGILAQYPWVMGLKSLFAGHDTGIAHWFCYSIYAGMAMVTIEGFLHKKEIKDHANQRPRVADHIENVVDLFKRIKRMGQVEETTCDDLLK